MFVYPSSWTLEAELAGVGAGWTDVSADVRRTQPIAWTYGIDGNGLSDRVATIGRLTFALNNAENNSARKLGYYAADSVNLRSGFDIGINVRFSITYGGLTYTKFRGRLASFDPLPGKYGARTTVCVVTDYLDELSRAKLKRVPIQIDKRPDEILTTIIAAMATQPATSTFGVGKDIYPFALDGSPEEGLGALSECSKIALSEVGYIYQKGNTTGGGEFVFESRTDRAGKNTTLFTFDESMLMPGSLAVSRNRDYVITRLQVKCHPKKKDAATQVIFQLRDANVGSATAVTLGPLETKTLVAPFTNSNNQLQRIGAASVVAPVATTDYLMNAAADGSGANLTASLAVLMTTGANAAFVTLTNTSASLTGYITQFQLRGIGIYDMQEVIFEQSDAAAQAQFGENVETYDMPYQSDPDVASGAALYFIALLKNGQTNVDRFGILANKSDTLMTQALLREPGDRIGLSESATGLASAAGWFIQSCSGSLEGGGIVKLSFGVAPASRQDFWLLGIAGASELGETTYVGF